MTPGRTREILLRVDMARTQIQMARRLFRGDPTMESIAMFLSSDMDDIERLIRATRTELDALDAVVVGESHDV